jgi:hypothetical protein
MLNSAEKAGIDMSLFHLFLMKENKDSATYNTMYFNQICQAKVQVILANLELDDILWVDNDIVFFENVLEELSSCEEDIVFQDDDWAPCLGFFRAKSTQSVKDMFRKVLESMKLHPEFNDQHAIIRLLPAIDLDYALLDAEKYANGNVYFNKDKTDKAKIVHGNYLTTTDDKEWRFNQANLWSPKFDISKINLHHI